MRKRKRRFRISIAAAKIRWKLKRGQEPEPELLLALLGDIRKMVIPPEHRRAPKDLPETTSAFKPPTAVDDFEWNVVVGAIHDLYEEVQAVTEANREKLSDAVINLYFGIEEAIREPENAHLIPHYEKMRAHLSRVYDGEIPSREEMLAELEWAKEMRKKT